ncbi:hypothetical protein L1887_11540 [Cichorium endivia]|nr:hypothetical protein L1887_11540 [Cichorium endivia]
MDFHSFNPNLVLILASTAPISPCTIKTFNELANLEVPPNSSYEDFVLFLQSHPLSTTISFQSVGINVNALCEFWYTSAFNQDSLSIVGREMDFALSKILIYGIGTACWHCSVSRTEDDTIDSSVVKERL